MKKTILVVSDSKDFQSIIKAIFSEARSVFCASSSEEAFNFILSRPVHLIITSLKFEQNPAAMFVHKLRSMDKRISDIPVVLLTNTINAEISMASSKYGITIMQLPAEPVSLEADVNVVIIKNSKGYEKPDPLTGLNKKRLAEEQIADMLASGKKGALMLISVDPYSFASAVISEESFLACRDVLKDIITKTAVLAVANKHSFILFVPDLRNKEDIEKYSAQIIESFNNKSDGKKVYVSIGLASTDRHGNDYAELYRICDLGLDMVRNQGKNKACFYSW